MSKSFRSWVFAEVQRQFNRVCSKGEKDAIAETFTVIRYDAEKRGQQALIQALGVEKEFLNDVYVHQAVNVIVQAVVAGVFGEIPLTNAEKAAKLDAFLSLYGLGNQYDKDDQGGLTMKTMKTELEKMKKSQGPMQILYHGKTYSVVEWQKELLKELGAFGPPFKKAPASWHGQYVKTGPWMDDVAVAPAKKPQPMPAKKSGLPAAQKAKEDEEAALLKLAAQVEKKSDELLGIKQKAKYEELAGIDPEEI